MGPDRDRTGDHGLYFVGFDKWGRALGGPGLVMDVRFSFAEELVGGDWGF